MACPRPGQPAPPERTRGFRQGRRREGRPTLYAPDPRRMWRMTSETSHFQASAPILSPELPAPPPAARAAITAGWIRD